MVKQAKISAIILIVGVMIFSFQNCADIGAPGDAADQGSSENQEFLPNQETPHSMSLAFEALQLGLTDFTGAAEFSSTTSGNKISFGILLKTNPSIKINWHLTSPDLNAALASVSALDILAFNAKATALRSAFLAKQCLPGGSYKQTARVHVLKFGCLLASGSLDPANTFIFEFTEGSGEFDSLKFSDGLGKIYFSDLLFKFEYDFQWGGQAISADELLKNVKAGPSPIVDPPAPADYLIIRHATVSLSGSTITYEYGVSLNSGRAFDSNQSISFSFTQGSTLVPNSDKSGTLQLVAGQLRANRRVNLEINRSTCQTQRNELVTVSMTSSGPLTFANGQTTASVANSSIAGGTVGALCASAGF